MSQHLVPRPKQTHNPACCKAAKVAFELNNNVSLQVLGHHTAHICCSHVVLHHADTSCVQTSAYCCCLSAHAWQVDFDTLFAKSDLHPCPAVAHGWMIRPGHVLRQVYVVTHHCLHTGLLRTYAVHRTWESPCLADKPPSQATWACNALPVMQAAVPMVPQVCRLNSPMRAC